MWQLCGGQFWAHRAVEGIQNFLVLWRAAARCIFPYLLPLHWPYAHQTYLTLDSWKPWKLSGHVAINLNIHARKVSKHQILQIYFWNLISPERGEWQPRGGRRLWWKSEDGMCEAPHWQLRGPLAHFLKTPFCRLNWCDSGWWWY